MSSPDPFSAFKGGFTDLLKGAEILRGTTNTIAGNQTSGSRSEATANISGEARDRLEISDEAINKIVNDILSGPEGLASIFGGEQVAGIFDSSVAAQAAGDLTAKISGEIAKLRAERVQTENRTQIQTKTTESESEFLQRTKKKGLLEKLFGF